MSLSISSAAPQLGGFKVPTTENEPMRNYEAKSSDRTKLQAAVDEMIAAGPREIPCIINGKRVTTGKIASQLNPSDHAKKVCTYHEADPALVQEAITGALEAKKTWENMPWNDRAAVFMKAADLIAHKYRYKLLAATMLGQGKNVWQAEIDAAAETCDFFRFGVQFVESLYATQPGKNAPTTWNRSEYRALEGFVLAVSPFNFTAISGNLFGVPALVGNVVVWKPSPMAILSNYILLEIMEEAGLPAGVVQFVPGPAEPIVGAALSHREFSALHFTGSTFVFRQLWKQIAQNLDNYRGYPRIVGETGGKNFHLVHKSAHVDSAVSQAIRGAFEYQGQKCSALSRLYVPQSLWEQGGFKNKLLERVSQISVGPVNEFQHFMGPVIAQHSFDKIMGLIDAAKKSGGTILAGGTGDDSKGYYVQPTVIETKDPKSVTMVNEIFGPVLTVYAYPDAEFEKICGVIDTTTEYALTGAIFATDRHAIVTASNLLRNASGMFYINDKCTGAVVGQQPFGGARASGTNDKAGSMSIFWRFTSQRTIKETYIQPETHLYPSNLS
ncbi:1-pyrroline-5-carboxylate dehydrogenase [Tilletia horrida]|uniref:Multifunctional fusion protein n=1 Tax=Tilletia horrida TaxID=155126 RepID=A0AAN6GTC8_9BASI|nr:1-pyrroline-5-carboxylate dehydrogenase [Tilletia horrida]KAK0549097.1 1-pyrroline-5-carboxylate dehydrogenase [Tilletia horrida]